MIEPKSSAEAMEMFAGMTDEQKAAYDELLTAGRPLWVAQPGPQRSAFDSKADILFYGGAAGGGKSSLMLGLSITTQNRSIIFRRESVQLTGLEEDMTRIVGNREGYNSTTGMWRLPNGRTMELGSVKEPGDWIKFQGRAHDFKGFDEICHFTEGQFRALIGWLRSDDPAQRQRVVCAGNPPTDASGEWVKRFWLNY